MEPRVTPPVSLEPMSRARVLRPWLILALLMLLSAANQFHRVSLSALEEGIRRDHPMSDTDFGALLSIFLYTYTLCMAPGGWLADRIGTWWTLALVMAGSGVFGALCGLTGWLALGPVAAWWWLAFARGGMGVLSAPIYPSTSRTVGNWLPAGRQALGNGLIIAAAPLGMAVSYRAMPLLAARAGWHAAFLIAGAATLGVMALWCLLGRGHPRSARGAPPRGEETAAEGRAPRWMDLLRHRGVLALTLSYATVGYFEYLLFYWADHYFREVLRLGGERSAAYTTYLNLSMMVCTPLGGWAAGSLVKRWGIARGLRAMGMGSMVLAACALLAGALVPGIGWKVLSMALAMGFIGASEGPFWTAAVRLGGPYGATSGGFVNTGGNLLGAVAPTATPLIAAWVNGAGQGAETGPLGWTVALAAGAALCLVGAAFWLWVDADRPLRV